MLSLKLAFRNLIRSKKRAVTAMMVISVSTLTMLMFRGFVENIQLGFGTSVIRFTGHIGIFKQGYNDFGSGKLKDYVIQDWKNVEKWLMDDPYLKEKIENIQPRLDVGGLVGNSEKENSTNFYGFGSIPNLRKKFFEWDGNNLGEEFKENNDEGLRDWDMNGGIVALKLARTLGVCIREKTSKDGECEPTKVRINPDVASGKNITSDSRQKIQILSGLSGAPNIVNMSVAKIKTYGDENTDNSFISMHLGLAQKLIFSKIDNRVSGVFFQLKKTSDLNQVEDYLNKKIKKEGIKLEIKNYLELFPVFRQVLLLFKTIFIFVSIILSITALFSINNTMVMCVMERVSEIGTLRSMGLRAIGIQNIFLMEGLLLGILGSTGGIVVGSLICFSVNYLEPSWIPPSSTEAVPIRLQVFKDMTIIPAIWFIMTIASCISAIFPAQKASRMNIVDALRDV